MHSLLKARNKKYEDKNDKNISRDIQNPASILYKSTAVRDRPVGVADRPITARYRFIKNASWGNASITKHSPPKAPKGGKEES